MKKQIIYFLIVSWVVAVSCSKDLGNYTYENINKVDIDLAGAPLSVFMGDTLKVTPTLKPTLDTDTGNYTYQWSLKTGEQLSSARDLVYKVTQAPGNYVLEYYVTDKKTGVTWQQRTPLQISTPIYEGYLVLNDVNGQSRLDMLSYRDGGFVQYTDVLGHVGSELSLTGSPLKIASINARYQAASEPNYHIFILTDKVATRIDPETFGWSEKLEIRNRFLGAVPDNFTPDNLIVSAWLNFPYFSLMDNNRLIQTNGNTPFTYSLFTNYYPDNLAVIPISEKIATVGSLTTVYNTAEKKFMSYTAPNFQYINKEAYPGYPEGLELVDLFNNHYGLNFNEFGRQKSPAYAILRDPQTSKYSLLKFYIGLGIEYYVPLDVPGIEGATHFAVSPELDYLFYSTGSKVYQYDVPLNKAQLMLDLGNEQVSMLTFVPFFKNMTLASTANYTEWGKWLTVATYDPSKPAGTEGSLSLYEVPPVNRPLIKKQEWQGFGKIVSLTYRER